MPLDRKARVTAIFNAHLENLLRQRAMIAGWLARCNAEVDKTKAKLLSVKEAVL